MIRSYRSDTVLFVSSNVSKYKLFIVHIINKTGSV